MRGLSNRITIIIPSSKSNVCEIIFPIDAPCSDPLAPRSPDPGWIRQCLSLIVMSAFLAACTLGSQTPKRMDREMPKETREGLTRDVAVKGQKADSDKSGSSTIGRGDFSHAGEEKVSEEDEGQEVAAFNIDLSNFKERLATLSGAEVIELMGPPEFERSEPPARIWQYRAPACVLNLFLYHNRGGLAVEYVELRTRRTVSDDVNDRDCFVSNIRRLPQKTGEAAPGADLS